MNRNKKPSNKETYLTLVIHCSCRRCLLQCAYRSSSSWPPQICKTRAGIVWTV